MKISKRIVPFCLLFLLFIAGCKKEERNYNSSLPPNVLFFLIKKDGQILPDSVLYKVILFYVGPGGAIHDRLSYTSYDTSFVFPGSRSSGGMENSGALCSGYVGNITAEKGVHDWYLKYPDGDIDTLYIEVAGIGVKEGAKNRCYCDKPFTVVRFNSKDAPEATEIKTDNGKPVFLFEK